MEVTVNSKEKNFLKVFSESGICLGDKCPFKQACDRKENFMPMSDSLSWESKICLDTLTEQLDEK